MRPYVTKSFRRLTAAGLTSSTLSIGIASTFVLATTALSLVVDGPVPPESFGGGWVLRGALGTADPAPTAPPTHAATAKARQLG